MVKSYQTTAVNMWSPFHQLCAVDVGYPSFLCLFCSFEHCTAWVAEVEGVNCGVVLAHIQPNKKQDLTVIHSSEFLRGSINFGAKKSTGYPEAGGQTGPEL